MGENAKRLDDPVADRERQPDLELKEKPLEVGLAAVTARERLQGEAGAGSRLPDPRAHAHPSLDDIHDREYIRFESLRSGERGQGQLLTKAEGNHLTPILALFEQDEMTRNPDGPLDVGWSVQNFRQRCL